MMSGSSFQVESVPDENGRCCFFANNPCIRVSRMELQVKLPETIKPAAFPDSHVIADIFIDYLPVN